MAACVGTSKVPAEGRQRNCTVSHRYQELQKLLGVENIEKAQLLMQAADYTRQLQVGCQQTTLLGCFMAVFRSMADVLIAGEVEPDAHKVIETEAGITHGCRQP